MDSLPDLPRTTGIAAHPQVIFADNFEQGELGASWDEVRNRDGKVLSLVDQTAEQPSPIGRKSLQVTATLGENTGGGLTKWFESSDRIFIRFYTKFHPECDYVHHFCTLRANKGLQGQDRWSGFGGAGELPKGEERFSTALEPWGDWGRLPPPGRWNFYSYWHTMNQSRDGKYWGNAFRPEEQPNIERGKWICAEMMIKHNSPGQDDGEQALLDRWRLARPLAGDQLAYQPQPDGQRVHPGKLRDRPLDEEPDEHRLLRQRGDRQSLHRSRGNPSS